MKNAFLICFLLFSTSVLGIDDFTRKVNTHAANAMNPAIYEDLIVWEDYRNAKADPYHGSDIFLYNYSGNWEMQVTPRERPYDFGTREPAIHGNLVAFVLLSNIALYEIDTGNNRLPVWFDRNYSVPAVWGNIYTFTSSKSIYYYYSNTSLSGSMDRRPHVANNPRIYRDIIVWWEFDIEYISITPLITNYNIYYYNITAGGVKRLPIFPGANSSTIQIYKYPDIFGNLIVWEDYRNGNADIYLYDLSTQTEIRLTTEPHDQRKPRIYENRVVYEDYRSGSRPNLYLYDLSTGTETQLTYNAFSEVNPDLWGDLVVWQDNSNGNWSIYVRDLNIPIPSPTPTPLPTPTPPPTPTPTPVPTPTPEVPILSNINAVAGNTTANITWNTDIISMSRLNLYRPGETTYDGFSNFTYTTRHFMRIQNLLQGTTYDYRVRSCSTSGGCSEYEYRQFTTTGTPAITPTPTPRPTTTPTPTAGPSTTPTPRATAGPTDQFPDTTPTPTETPEPTETLGGTPAPTPTRRPTIAPTTTRTPSQPYRYQPPYYPPAGTPTFPPLKKAEDTPGVWALLLGAGLILAAGATYYYTLKTEQNPPKSSPSPKPPKASKGSAPASKPVQQKAAQPPETPPTLEYPKLELRTKKEAERPDYDALMRMLKKDIERTKRE